MSLWKVLRATQVQFFSSFLQDRPSEDVLKVLQLIKKLARSDTRGVMAHK